MPGLRFGIGLKLMVVFIRFVLMVGLGLKLKP